MDYEEPSIRRHLLIAGTGRAGTSFLVRYLTELGLDSRLRRYGENAGWDENANAGLEDAPFPGMNSDLPYVIKSPWIYQCIDGLLTDDTFALDAVVIPVRDLAEAAASRSVIERRAAHQSAPWMSGLDTSWEEWGHVPGGIVFSMNPIDQGRLLAVGFYHLVQRLIKADIPIIFLAFPRLTYDADYLFDKLRPVLPLTVDHQMACSAHQSIADPAKVRIGSEIESEISRNKAPSTKVMRYEPHESLDSIAIRRELGRLRKQFADASCATDSAKEQLRSARAAAAEEGRHLRDRISAIEAALAEAVAAANREKAESDGLRMEADQYHRQVQRLTDEMSQHRRDAQQSLHQVGCLTTEISQLRQEAISAAEHRRELEVALARMHASRSWRLTQPCRATGLRLTRLYRRFLGHRARRDF